MPKVLSTRNEVTTWHNESISTTRDVLQQTAIRSRLRSLNKLVLALFYQKLAAGGLRNSVAHLTYHRGALPFLLVGITLSCTLVARVVAGAGGSLTVKVRDEESDQHIATRAEIYRGDPTGKPIVIRKLPGAGFGCVVDGTAELSLADGSYSFRLVRGPEYRIVSGSFVLERTSLDEHAVALPRMVNMLDLGWTSGDCLVPRSTKDLRIRMAAEDLHVAATPGLLVDTHKVQAGPFSPIWIDDDVQFNDGLAFYNNTTTSATVNTHDTDDAPSLTHDRLSRLTSPTRVAIENPFAWAVPVWLSSGKIDGIFVLGDWLRLDKTIHRPIDGRPSPDADFDDGQSLGRYAERIYWNMLEAGFKLAPLAGCGDEADTTPVGYNRLYVGEPLAEYESFSPDSPEEFPPEADPVADAQAWWAAAWAGQSVATNGPLLRPKVGGKLPGHTFQANRGETLQLGVELTLSVRDPVDYLEVIHNGRVHYSARLDEFALAGGRIPELTVNESGWVIVRVVTQYQPHFRAAMSAPWYIEFEGKRRVTREAVAYFQEWQAEYEKRLTKLPADEIARHAPCIRTSRSFWQQRLLDTASGDRDINNSPNAQ